MKKLVLFFTVAVNTFINLHARDTIPKMNTENVRRISIINPGFESEYALRPNTTASISVGAGFTGGELPHLKENISPGVKLVFSPFIDFQLRRYYSLNKRLERGKNISQNSGNFFGIRSYLRGPELSSTFSRTNDYELILEPLWGTQRTFGRFHILFATGPIVYTDFIGNWGFDLFFFDFNMGISIGN